MPRHKDRKLTQFDLLYPLKGEGKGKNDRYVLHWRNARGSIERLRYDGRAYFSEGSSELEKWTDECDKLWREIMNIDLSPQDINTMKDFAYKIDHLQLRLHELLSSSKIEDSKREKYLNATLFWFNTFYRSATYAILSVANSPSHNPTNIKKKKSV